ncbi:MAG: Dabb family protein [Akkermansiaceae bacterium]
MEHHVYFWLKEERKNAGDRDLFEKGLADLYQIKEVAGGIWGQSSATPERPVTDKSFDYALSMSFETIDDHNVYQADPAHDLFVESFKDWWEKVLVMDVG